MAEKASVQVPGFIAGVGSFVEGLALIDFGANHRLFLAVGNSLLHQFFNVQTSFGYNVAALVNGALGKAFQIFSRFDGRLILDCLDLGNLLGCDVVGSSTLRGDLVEFFVLIKSIFKKKYVKILNSTAKINFLTCPATSATTTNNNAIDLFILL